MYFGCANQAGEDNRNVARMAALLAGLPVEVAGITVNRLCASGLNAVNQAARAIRAGEGEVFIAGGVESMSRAPYSIPKAEAAVFLRESDGLGYDLGLAVPKSKFQESNTGRNRWVKRLRTSPASGPHLTREMQDAFAVRSHHRAVAAIDSGKFAEEIVPVTIPQSKGPAKAGDDG